MSAIQPKSSSVAPGLSLSRSHFVGKVSVAACPAGLWTGTPPSMESLVVQPDIRVAHFKNLETDYVLSGVAKLFTGELTSLDIKPTSMAVGQGSDPISSADTGLSSEIIRKSLAASGSSINRAGSKAIFRITLFPGEVLGRIGSVGLLNGDSGGGSASTGSLTVGGSPKVGDSIVVSLGGRALPVYWVTSTSTDAVAAGLAAWLTADDYCASLYTCVSSNSGVWVTSVGKGSGYNQTLRSQVSGGVTCAATDITGGASPGGNLLAAANVSFTKEHGVQILIEWSINLTN